MKYRRNDGNLQSIWCGWKISYRNAGIFSKEMNAAMLRQYDCRYLLKKDTGKAGGFQEKIDVANECGVIPVIIGRSLKEDGLTVTACKRMLAEKFGFILKQHITLLIFKQ